MSFEETTLSDGTKVYRTEDGSFFIRIYAMGEASVEEMCKKHGCTKWDDEYSRDVNADFRKEFPFPEQLDKTSQIPFYLKLNAAEKKKMTTHIRNHAVTLITGANGPGTVQFGARMMPASPSTIRT